MIKPDTKIRKTPCKTCPFAGKTPVPLSDARFADILGKVINNESHHLCHSDATNHTICNGSLTVAVRAWYALGVIPKPTFEAWYQVLKEKKTWNTNIIPPEDNE